MSNQEGFKRYLALKKRISLNYKGIDYAEPLSHDIARIAFDAGTTPSFKEILKGFILKKDTSLLVEAIETSKNLFTYSVDRKDYLKQVNDTIIGVEMPKIVLVENLPDNKVFNAWQVFSAIRIVKRAFGNSITFRQQLFLAGSICKYKAFHEDILKRGLKNKSVKNYIAFNSAYRFESLLTRLMQLSGINTFSLSHSFYVKYGKFTPLDIINVENITAEKIFVWGKTSVTDLEQNFNIPPNRVIVGGNPKYATKQISVKQSFKKCIVLLGRIIYHESNLRIVDILKAFIKLHTDVEVVLKLHLSLDNDLYRQYCEGTAITIQEGKESLTELFENGGFDFAIVNNSTAYYEAMYFDMICLRYGPDENEQFTGLDDRFEDAQSLSNRIEHFRTLDAVILNNQIQQIMVDTLGMGVNNYKQYLNGD